MNVKIATKTIVGENKNTISFTQDEILFLFGFSWTSFIVVFKPKHALNQCEFITCLVYFPNKIAHLDSSFISPTIHLPDNHFPNNHFSDNYFPKIFRRQLFYQSIFVHSTVICPSDRRQLFYQSIFVHHLPIRSTR